MGRGSRTRSSLPKLRRSSSMPTKDGWRRMMLLMVDAEDETLVLDEYEARAVDDRDEDRRNELRSLEGEKRPETVSNRVLNMVAVGLQRGL